MSKSTVIAAVKTKEMFDLACSSKPGIIFDLLPNIDTIEENVLKASENGKILFVHIDLAEGIGKDKAGLKFLKRMGVNGIISTRASMIKSAMEIGLKTVQRIFILDSQSIKSAEAVLQYKPDMIEILPGIMPSVIKEIAGVVNMPIIAGGLIKTTDDILSAVNAGATTVSTSLPKLWEFEI